MTCRTDCDLLKANCKYFSTTGAKLILRQHNGGCAVMMKTLLDKTATRKKKKKLKHLKKCFKIKIFKLKFFNSPQLLDYYVGRLSHSALHWA